MVIKEREITDVKLQSFSKMAEPIGISVGYHPRGHLETICIVAGDKSIIITIDGEQPPPDRNDRMAKLERHILCRGAGELFAFGMADISMSLLSKLGLHVSCGVNIESGFRDIGKRNPSACDCLRATVGEDMSLATTNIETSFSAINRPSTIALDKSFSPLTQRAWAAQFIAGYQNAEVHFSHVKRINTQAITPEVRVTVLISFNVF